MGVNNYLYFLDKLIMKHILIINGPNLNLLGKREPKVYGSISFEDFFKQLQEKNSTIELDYFQSNHEGEIIDKLQESNLSLAGIILNAGAYTHTSIAIADAIASIKTPVLEIHISNIYAREDFRKHSYTAKNCVGVITGLGLKGYELGVRYLANL